MALLKNIGNAKSPLDLGHGVWAYKRKGHWWYRDSETTQRFGKNKFIEATDVELMLELENRGFKVICPSHECVDRPNLPCPACERDGIQALKALKVG